jgi:hypothetical protein
LAGVRGFGIMEAQAEVFYSISIILRMGPRQVTKLRQCRVLQSISCRTALRSRTGAASYNVVENRGIS